jgi:hypothetical protein
VLSNGNVDIETNPELFYEIHDNIISPRNNGNFVFIITKSEKTSLNEGSVIIAKSNGPVKTRLYVEDGNDYVIYLNEKYSVQDNIYSAITVSGNEYRVMLDDDGNRYAFINGNKVTLDASGRPTNKMYYSSNNTNVKYGINKNGYEISGFSGVIINGKVHKVISETETRVVPNSLEPIEITEHYIEIKEDITYELTVGSKDGANTYICFPTVKDEDFHTNDEIAAIKKQEVDSIEKRLSRLEKRDEDLTEKINSTAQDIAKLDKEIGKYAGILSNLRKEKRNKNISLRNFREKKGDIKNQITTCTVELKKARQNLAQITTIEVLIYENSDFEVADIAKAPISDPRKSENFTARVINACAELSEKPNCKNLSPIDVMSVSVAKIIKEDNPDRNIKFIFENGDKLLDILKALEK